MKTLIVYSSKYGFAESCVQDLKGKLQGEITVANAQKDKIPNVEGFGNVIIGSSVYMGQVNKKVKEFAQENLDKLLSKKVGLFLCCGFTEKFNEVLEQSFPKELLNNAAAKECFGGEMNKEKLKFLHRKICEMIEKQDGSIKIVSLPENIEKLASEFN